MSHSLQNHLSEETSPYLLQHVHQPVDWYPWSETALNLARSENKPILLSIGYSSCHWCHVMAHESFENAEIAELMNAFFINIKLDREERPDIDNIYMDAIQAMGLRGGWPLNVFLTPDQKPFYGGTYFPAVQWKKLITSVHEAYQTNQDKLEESASKFAHNLQQSEAEKYGLLNDGLDLHLEDFKHANTIMAHHFDSQHGGFKRAPKFPMPTLWNYMLSYGAQTKDEYILNHVFFTLDKIAAGGIYDQIGGGFSRYAVDGEWHVPHFEKMLYDNGQLMSLYANAFKLSKNSTYKTVLTETAQWLEREMLSDEGGFFSALDADSEGVEGKFYVWTFEEFKEVAGSNASLLAEYYEVTQNGNWEHSQNVLRRLETDAIFCSDLGIDESELQDKLKDFKINALTYRNERIKPGLDSKILSGWNGLSLSGLCHAFQATGDPLFSRLAIQNAKFIQNKLWQYDKLIRTYGKPTEAFLEDYAAVIQSFIDYYETFFDEAVLIKAQQMMDRVITNFYDESEGLFFYTSSSSESLIVRKKEIFDNVIPASNSIMAENLYRLGIMLDHEPYRAFSRQMISRVNPLLRQEVEYLSNWARLSLTMLTPTAEIIIVGKEALRTAADLNREYIHNKVLMASTINSNLPLFEYKESNNDQTTTYVCYDKVCKRPAFSIAAVIHELHERF